MWIHNLSWLSWKIIKHLNFGFAFSNYEAFPDVDPIVIVITDDVSQFPSSMIEINQISNHTARIYPKTLPANFPTTVLSSNPKTMHSAPNPRFSVLWQCI